MSKKDGGGRKAAEVSELYRDLNTNKQKEDFEKIVKVIFPLYSFMKVHYRLIDLELQSYRTKEPYNKI